MCLTFLFIYVQVWNDHGWLKDTSELNVRCAPEFKRDLKDFTAKEGDTNVEFSINVVAYPKPTVKWYVCTHSQKLFGHVIRRT
jgi:hypothetical protein